MSFVPGSFSDGYNFAQKEFESRVCKNCAEYCDRTGYCPVKNHTMESDEICKEWRVKEDDN